MPARRLNRPSPPLSWFRRIVHATYDEKHSANRTIDIGTDAAVLCLWLCTIAVMVLKAWPTVPAESLAEWTLVFYAIGVARHIGRDAAHNRPLRELPLCILFVLAHCLLMYKRWNIFNGFDAGSHMEYSSAISWTRPFVLVNQTPYSFHPPLGILLGQIPTWFGAPPVLGAQLASFLASLVAFLMTRSTLRYLRLLTKPVPVAFLYLTYSIPLQTYLATSINLDIFVFAFSSICLHGAARLYLGTKPAPFAVWPLVYVVAGIAGASLSKASGLLTFAIPLLLMSMTWPSGRNTKGRTILKHLAPSVVSVLLALCLLLPYYWMRYEMQTGSLVFTHGMPQDHQAQDDARLRRDQHKLAFLYTMFTSTAVHREGPQFRDKGIPRLSDTWKDFWVRDVWLGSGLPMEGTISYAYWRAMPPLLLLGLLLWLGISRTAGDASWRRLGWWLMAFGLLQIIALLYYMYDMPWGGALPNKGAYIAAVCWAIGLLLSQLYYVSRALSKSAAYVYQQYYFGAVVLFVLINALVPVY